MTRAAKIERKRPGIAINPRDLLFVCTACNLKTRRSAIDVNILLGGRFVVSPPALVEAPCPVCCVTWPHFVDLKTP